MIHTIIACTDFSPAALNAVQYAAALAESRNARLILYHHFTYPVPATDMPNAIPNVFIDELAANYESRLEDMVGELEKAYKIKVDQHVRSWDFFADLEELVRTEHAQLVVMGMKGRSAAANAWMGSYASGAIRQGHLPLLVIPAGTVFHSFKHILFACDRREGIQTETLQPMVDLAASFDAYLRILTLLPEGEDVDKSVLEPVFKTLRHGYYVEHHKDVYEGVRLEATRHQADLIAMVPHQHSLLANLFKPGETQKVASGIHLPLLVLGERVAQPA